MLQRTAEQAAALGIPLSVLDDHPKVMVATKTRKSMMCSESYQMTFCGAKYKTLFICITFKLWGLSF